MMSSSNLAKKIPAYLFLGAPGSGKGTQGKVLGMIPRLFHCACGDVFRALDTNSELGQKFVSYSSRGELVPDELTVDLWRSQISKWQDSGAYKIDKDILILDGIPRNTAQAKILEQYVEVIQVFHLSCPDRAELAKRIQQRAVKENRMDDASDKVIENRIATYELETKPILDFYCDRISDIDATQSPLAVSAKILARMVELSEV